MLSVNISDIGAELMSVNSKNTEYLWQGSPKLWEGKAYNLFPIIGRLNQGIYTYKGETYKMQLHGFLRTSELQVSKHEKDKITFELRYNDVTLAQYPFKFLYRISYELNKNKININYNIVNFDDQPIYFNVGGHPGFNVPLKNGLKFEDYFIEFSDAKIIKKHELDKFHFMSGKVIEYELNNGRILPLKHKMFVNDALIFSDTCKTAALKTLSDQRSVTVNFPDMKYFALWQNAKTKAPFVCMEIWEGLPSTSTKIDDIETKEDIITLDTKKEYNNSWSIEIN